MVYWPRVCSMQIIMNSELDVKECRSQLIPVNSRTDTASAIIGRERRVVVSRLKLFSRVE
jgi:hypothetical protein